MSRLCASRSSARSAVAGYGVFASLDLHNLLGIATIIWALVGGVTGTINTASDLVRAVLAI